MPRTQSVRVPAGMNTMASVRKALQARMLGRVRAERLQPLGYLAWAASGKDPGFSPEAILEHAARSSHYAADEVAERAFAGPPPDAADRSVHTLARFARPGARGRGRFAGRGGGQVRAHAPRRAVQGRRRRRAAGPGTRRHPVPCRPHQRCVPRVIESRCPPSGEIDFANFKARSQSVVDVHLTMS